MKHVAACVLLTGVATVVFAGDGVPTPELSAAQIVEKNIAVRGGLEAWHNIQTMVWIGHIETANAPASRIPFVLEQKRPNKTRFEIKVQNQTALRIFDGIAGWKSRPSANGKPELQPFSVEELGYELNGPSLDGPLMDAAAKGLGINLEGIDTLDGSTAYRLKVKRLSGASQRIWIDTQTYFDLKSERLARNAAGQTGTVTVLYHDYRPFEGVQIPMRIETGTRAATSATAPDRMVIDKVALNLPLDDSIFAKPEVSGQHHGVTVDTRQASQPTGPMGWPSSRSQALFSPGPAVGPVR